MKIQILIYVFIFANIAVTMENDPNPSLNDNENLQKNNINELLDNGFFNITPPTHTNANSMNTYTPLHIHSVTGDAGLQIEDDFNLEYFDEDLNDLEFTENLHEEENENKTPQYLSKPNVNRKLFCGNMNSNIKPAIDMINMNDQEISQFTPCNTARNNLFSSPKMDSKSTILFHYDNMITKNKPSYPMHNSSNRLMMLNPLSPSNENVDKTEPIETNVQKMNLKQLRKECMAQGGASSKHEDFFHEYKHNINYILLNVLTAMKREEIKEAIKDTYEDLAYRFGGDEEELQRLKQNLENFSSETIADLQTKVDKKCSTYAPMKNNMKLHTQTIMKAKVQKVFLDKIFPLNQHNNTLKKNK